MGRRSMSIAQRLEPYTMLVTVRLGHWHALGYDHAACRWIHDLRHP